ncbi:MAG: tail fiber protein [Candidatus Moraniibacteriota bacterium]
MSKLNYALGSFFLLFFILITSINVIATPDKELTYHGKLTDTSNVAVSDGDYDFTLTIYDADTGGNCLWTSRGTCGTPTAKSITVTNGIFNTILGEVGDNLIDIDFSQNYYLGVKIGSNPEMTPRRKVTPTGFALNAHRLNGQTEDYYLNTGSTNQTKVGSLEIGGDFAVNSNDLFVDTANNRVGIGTSTTTETLTVNGGVNFGNTVNSNAGTIRWTGTDFEGYDGSSWLSLTSGGSGGASDFLSLTDTIGSYTSGSILFTNAAGVLDDNTALFWDDINNQLGIGTNSTLESLTIAGALNIGNTTNTNAGTIRWTGADFEGYDGSNWLSLTDNGADISTINKVEKLWEGQYTDYSTCVVMEDKGVQCWGRDDDGQLGTGADIANKLFPQEVVLPGDVESVVSTKNINYAILENGHAYAWGRNNEGQIGDGTTTTRHTPVRVGTLENVETIVTARMQMQETTTACAIDSSGNVSCWGYNAYGQVGDGTTTNATSPVQVLTGVNNIYGGNAAYASFCAAKIDGTVWCWGYNGYGQLGDGTTTNRSNPIQINIANVSDMVIDGSYPGQGYKCAIKTDGTVWCWGYNGYGQLGVGDTTQRNAPTQVSGITTATSIKATGGIRGSTFVTLQDGTVRGWGYNNHGQLGDGTTTNQVSPVDSGLTNVSKIIPGGSAYDTTNRYVHSTTCALHTDGTVSCFGYNAYGQVGNGTITDQTTPLQVAGLEDVQDLAVAGVTTGPHYCVKKTDGRMMCWGYNGYGQLGQGDILHRYTPQYVKTINEAGDQPLAGSGLWTANGSDIYYTSGNVGINTTTPNYELDINGTTQTNILQLADSGANSNLWTLREQVDNNFAISLNGTQTLTLTESGSLGLGTTNPTHKLSVVGGDIYTSGNILASNITTQCPIGEALRGFDANGDPVCISVGAAGGELAINKAEKIWKGQSNDGTSCVVMEDKTVQCWGHDDSGEVGTGVNAADKPFPEIVNLPGDVEEVITNKHSTYAILENGQVYGWGYNAQGELGDGTTTVRHIPVRIGTLEDITEIATSENLYQNHGTVCALNDVGAVYCWGYNGYGQVGNGTTTQQTSPVQIIAADVTGISGGGSQYSSFCATKTDGSVWCWGRNSQGQVGDGTIIDRNIPTQISLSNVSKIVAQGGYGEDGHKCAIKNDGTVWCWGDNGNGALGVGDTADRHVPTQMLGITNAVDIAVGGDNGASTHVVLQDGTVRSTGYNGGGQLGIGTTTNSSTPVDAGLTDVSKVVIAGGYSLYGTVCALHNSGEVSCWGYNGNGQVGNGTTVNPQTTPSLVEGVEYAKDIAMGGFAGPTHACVTLIDGRMKCWGDNTYGQLGNGTETMRTTPQYVKTVNETYDDNPVVGGGLWTANGSDIYYTSGNVGINTTTPNYELDINGTTQTNILQLADSGANSNLWTLREQVDNNFAISLNGTQTLTLTESGSLGLGTTNPTHKLSVVGGDIYTSGNILASNITTQCPIGEALRGFDANGDPVCISVGAAGGETTINQVEKLWEGNSNAGISCAIMEDKKVQCWGRDVNGELGDDSMISNKYLPVEVVLPENVSSISTNRQITYAILENGHLYAWGYNGHGALGDGTTTQRPTPVRVGALENISKIATSRNLHNVAASACALDTSGNVYCWGYNASGQVGNGNTTQQTSPVQIITGNVADISGGGGNTASYCAQFNDGSVQCWGANAQGELGDGTTTARNTPTPITINNVSKMVAQGDYTGQVHRCAIKNDNTVWCWGNNDDGALGLGDTTNRTAPSQVLGITNAFDIAIGGDNGNVTFVVLQDGTVRSWGHNGRGQLGIGTTTNSNSPVDPGLTDVKDIIIAGGYNLYGTVCALHNSGEVSCWGYNANGQVGNGNTTDQYSPVKVSNIDSATQIAMGGYGGLTHTCVKTTGGRVQCWGYNGQGQLGNSTATNAYSPQYVKTINEAGDQPTTGLGMWTQNGSDIYYTSGNVGIGTNTPQEALDVDGAIRLGSTTNTIAGNIRWTGTDFEGYNGTQWKSFTSPDLSFLDLTDTPSSYIAGSIPYTNSIGNAIVAGTNLMFDGTNLDIEGSIRIGSDFDACDSSKEGSMRYNTTQMAMEFCNGTVWGALSTGSGGGGIIIGSTTSDYLTADDLNGGITQHRVQSDVGIMTLIDISNESGYLVSGHIEGASISEVTIEIDGVLQSLDVGLFEDEVGDDNTFINLPHIKYESSLRVVFTAAGAGDVVAGVAITKKDIGSHGTTDSLSAGTVNAYATEVCPPGWLEADGAEASRTAYPDLYAVLGDMYGDGDGSSTFNVPDYRGRFLRGWDHGAGLDPDAASRGDRGDGTTGDAVGTTQDDEFASHDHDFQLHDAENDAAGTTTGYKKEGVYNWKPTMTTQATGGSETRPTNVNVLYCVNTENPDGDTLWTENFEGIYYDGGNMAIGSENYGTDANNLLTISSSVAPTASITDGIQLFAVEDAGSHELRVRDEAGNVTTLSPHNFSDIPAGASEDMAWAYRSERDEKIINVDMTKAMRFIEKLTGEKLVYITDKNTGVEIPQIDSLNILDLPTPDKMQEIDTSIKSLTLKTDTNIVDLQSSTDDQFETSYNTINQVGDDVLELRDEANTLTQQVIPEINSRIDDLQASLSILTNIDTRVLALDVDKLIFVENGVLTQSTVDGDGNEIIADVIDLTLEGLLSVKKLVAQEIEINKLTVESQEDDSIVGKSVICPEDTSYDEADDDCVVDLESESDGQSIFVATEAVTNNSHIFVTPHGDVEQLVSVSEIQDGVGFIVKVKDAITNMIKFDWFIVEGSE